MHRRLGFARAVSRAGLVLATAAFMSLWVTGASTVEARVFDPETFTLDNGLQVVVVTNRRAPRLKAMGSPKALGSRRSGRAGEPPEGVGKP